MLVRFLSFRSPFTEFSFSILELCLRVGRLETPGSHLLIGLTLMLERKKGAICMWPMAQENVREFMGNQGPHPIRVAPDHRSRYDDNSNLRCLAAPPAMSGWNTINDVVCLSVDYHPSRDQGNRTLTIFLRKTCEHIHQGGPEHGFQIPRTIDANAGVSPEVLSEVIYHFVQGISLILVRANPTNDIRTGPRWVW